MINSTRLQRTILVSALGLAAAVPTFAVGEAPPALVSGEYIRVGAPHGRGPLAAHAVVSQPVGAAHVTGAEQPDLFVATGRFGAGRGLFLYAWRATAEDGAPVFADPVPVAFPFEDDYPPPGHIFQDADGAIWGLWLDGMELAVTRFDAGGPAFVRMHTVRLEGLPRPPRSVAAFPRADGACELALEVGDGVAGSPTDFSGRHPRFQPYDGRGIWRGGMPYAGLFRARVDALTETPSAEARPFSATEREVRISFNRLAPVNLGPGREQDLVTGSHFGELLYYPMTGPDTGGLDRRVRVVTPDGYAQRHPTVWAGPIAYPNPGTGLSDLIAGGEGHLHFYRFTGQFADNGAPVYENPSPVWEQDAHLFAGTLPVLNVVDWTGNGALDIVAGNSEGRVVLIENLGTNARPAFANQKPLEVRGQPIHVQGGYGRSLQGPGEARWGYTCPRVTDWSGNGLPDLLLSDITAEHNVFLNTGELRAPKLDPPRQLLWDGLELHGMWRVQPGAAEVNGRRAYVALDEDDEFRMYWQVDVYNVEDAGKLRLADGSVIGANFLSAGGTGRLKINFVDWTGNGLPDLLVGTPRHGSVPHPEHGLPQSLGLPGSAVLLLRNTGTIDAPRFAPPELVAFKGTPIFLGQHACSPAVAPYGTDPAPGLIVGNEDGRLIFYARGDLSTIAP